MDISFLLDRFCFIKLSDGKEYNCLKFDDLKHCDHVLKTVGIMTEELTKDFFCFSFRNVLATYEKGLAFMLDDDAPVKLLAIKDEGVKALNTKGDFDYSAKTKAAIVFLLKYFDKTTDQCTQSQVREETSQAVSMTGVETTADAQVEQTVMSTSMLEPDEQQQQGPNTIEKSTNMELGQLLTADCDPSDDADVDSMLDEKLPAKASAQNKSAAPKKKDTSSTSKTKKSNESAKVNKKRGNKESRTSPLSAVCASNVPNTQEEESVDQEPPNTTPPNQGPSEGRASGTLRASKKNSSKNDVATPLVKNMSKSFKKAPRESTPSEVEKWHDAITFDDLKSAFNEAGFKFTEGCYALPNKHPSVYKDAKLGRDYFETEKDFRKHLCAYGLDDCKDWDSETRECINIWVRYHIVDHQDKVPDMKAVKQNSIWKALTQVGFVYRDHSLFGPRYCFPGDGLEFVSDAACLEHVSRYGFPDNCDFSSMTEVEKIRLQMMVAEADRAKTFVPIAPDWDWGVLTGSGVITSTFTKRKRSPNPPPGIYSVTKKLEYQGSSAKRAKRQVAPQSELPKTPPRPTEIEDDPLSHSNGTPIHISATVTLSPAASTTLPEFSGTDKERLNACFNALKLHHSVGLMRFDPDGTSNLRANLASVENFLKGVFKTRSQDSYYDDGADSSSAAIHVCGEPGVGKTSGVMYCCNKVKDEVDLNHGFDVKVAKLNANDLKGINDLYEQLATALNTKPSKTSIMLKLRGKHASVKKNPPFLVLVVDEIDMMLSESDLVQTHRNSELVVKELLEYANSPELNFALIGISNSTGNNKYARLHQLGKFQDVVTFKPYTATDLQRILEVRVGHSVIQESALTAIAKKIATSRGDARRALDVAARAVAACLERTEDDVTTDRPLVTTADVMKTFKSFEKNYKVIIDGQPMAGKVILCVASVFAEKNMSVSLEDLQALVTEALCETGRLDDLLATDDFNLIVDMLVDSGLLKTSLIKTKGRRGRKKKGTDEDHANSGIELRMPLGDLKELLGAEMKIPFYRTLRERAASRVN